MTPDNTLYVVHAIAGLANSSGGPSQLVSDLCSALVDCGVQTEIVTTISTLTKGVVMPDPKKVQTRTVPANVIASMRFAWSMQFESVLAARCLEQKADLIHGHGIWMQVNHATSKLARRMKLPLIISPHGMLAPWSLRFNKMKKKMAMALYQWRDLQAAQVLHATAAQEAADFRAVGLMMPIAVIPVGINLPEWRAPENGVEPRTVLFLARLQPVKGLLDLVQAWSIVRPKGWRMVIAGPDENGHKAVVQNAVRTANLENIFSFLPAVTSEDKLALYRQADLFVLPSHSENFGLVVAEALACGIPVITTKGTPWEKIAKNGCGWWIDIGAAPLAAALREAMDASDNQRREMGLRGRQLAERDCNWHAIGNEMKSVYEWMRGAGAPPPCVRLD